MDTLTITSMKFKNFKGIKELEINPDGKNISIMGDNATGKTTIVDGFSWLLFDKDSAGKSDFQIKPTDLKGNEKHKIDTEVEGILNFSGTEIKLKKRYHEKWTKKHGTVTKEFSGHETDHFWDDVPISKGEYNNKLSGLIDSNVFKLVTSPYAFNDIPWADRKNILLSMCGDISDGDVADSLFPDAKDKDKHMSLINIINKASIEDHKKKVAAQQREINKEIDMIPVRIDEQTSTIKEVILPEEERKHLLEYALEKNETSLRELQTNEAASKKRVEINNINSEMIQEKNKFNSAIIDPSIALKKELELINDEHRVKKRKLEDTIDTLSKFNLRKDITDGVILSLYDKYDKAEEQKYLGEATCQACGQELPEDQIEEATENFNNLKAERIKKIQTEGKGLREALNIIEKDIKEAESEEDGLKRELLEIESRAAEKREVIYSVKVNVEFDSSSYEKRKDILKTEIEALENGSMVQQDNIKEKIAGIKKTLSEVAVSEAEYKASEKALARIVELEGMEKTLAAEYEALESELFLIEQFIVKKVETVEDQINSRFKLATFKLFKEQINGGIEPCCETLHGGIKFNHGLNNAARINVGLDIVDTLSEFYGFRAPVFIDNAESVNKLTKIDTQLIALYVTNDKKLIIK